MLYKFKSPATGPIIMLEPNGRQILHILGKDDPANLVKGILLPQDMPAAITALEAAVVQDDALLKQREDEAQKDGEDLPTPEGISLHQRAAPFIDMLQRAHKADKEIVWGV
jgi:hypothetical protein